LLAAVLMKKAGKPLLAPTTVTSQIVPTRCTTQLPEESSILRSHRAARLPTAVNVHLAAVAARPTLKVAPAQVKVSA
jgi:hypothetical protein